jgi:hypothetical protein
VKNLLSKLASITASAQPTTMKFAPPALAAIVTTVAPKQGSVNEWADDAIANTGPEGHEERVYMPGKATPILVNPDAYRERVNYLVLEDMMDASDANACVEAEVWAAYRRRKQADATNALAEKIVATDTRTMEQRIEDSNRAAEIISYDPADAIEEVTPAVDVAALEAHGEKVLDEVAAMLDASPVITPKKAPKKVKIVAPKPPAEKRKVGRPKKDDALTGVQRQAKSQVELKKAGGKRTTLNLSPGAVAAIANIQKKQGFKTDREAVEWALVMGEAL